MSFTYTFATNFWNSNALISTICISCTSVRLHMYHSYDVTNHLELNCFLANHTQEKTEEAKSEQKSLVLLSSCLTTGGDDVDVGRNCF